MKTTKEQFMLMREKAKAARGQSSLYWKPLPTGMDQANMRSSNAVRSHNRTPFMEASDADHCHASRPEAVLALLEDFEDLKQQNVKLQNELKSIEKDGKDKSISSSTPKDRLVLAAKRLVCLLLGHQIKNEDLWADNCECIRCKQNIRLSVWGA